MLNSKLQRLAIAVSLFLKPSAGLCREVQMLSFIAGQTDDVRPEPVSAGSEARSAPQPETSLQGLQPEFSTPSGVFQRVSVPAWMRGSSAYSTQDLRLVAERVGSWSGLCAPVPYRANVRLSAVAESRRHNLYPLLSAVACEAGISAHLLDALVTQESRYNSTAISPKGAVGLTQLMPETARALGVTNSFDVVQNLRGGAAYLRTQLSEFGRYDLALGAYNAGPERIRQYRGLPPFRETLSYVSRILSDVRSSLASSTSRDPRATNRELVRGATFLRF